VKYSNHVHRVLAAICLASSAAAGDAAIAQETQKRIIATINFPCGLNGFAKNLCAGFEAARAELPADYTFDLKSGVQFTDTVALNNLIENSIQLDPAGLIIFPNGPVAQVPVLKKACATGISIIVIDNAVEGLGACQSSYIATDSYRMGVQLGEWLIAHPPRNKEVGIVTFPRGQFASDDARVDGFIKTIEPAGYEVVATVYTDDSMDKTRTLVTNMITANPDIATILSTSEPANRGTHLAITDPGILQLTVDGLPDSAARIKAGELRADALQNPFSMAQLSVVSIVKLLEGTDVPAEIVPDSVVLDASNVDAFVEGGLPAIAKK
jgi:ribose transport system substrate-binding protein